MKKIIYSFTIVLFVLFFIACPTSVNTTVSFISVKTNPTKNSYYIDDVFDASGLIITVTYSDGTSEDVTYDSEDTNFSFSEIDLSVAGTKTITVTYKEKSTTFDIEVVTKGIFNISVETISMQKTELEGDLSIPIDEECTFSVTEKFSFYSWYIDGVLKSSTNNLVLSKDEIYQMSLGSHSLSIIVRNNDDAISSLNYQITIVCSNNDLHIELFNLSNIGIKGITSCMQGLEYRLFIDSTYSSCSWYLDNELKSNENSFMLTKEETSALALGNHNIFVIAYDNDSNVVSFQFTINVDSIPTYFVITGNQESSINEENIIQLASPNEECEYTWLLDNTEISSGTECLIQSEIGFHIITIRRKSDSSEEYMRFGIMINE